MKEKKMYLTPILERLEVEVESPIAVSAYHPSYVPPGIDGGNHDQ